MGPCHHGMARPQVVDERMASYMEGNCEYIEYADTDSNVGKHLRAMKLEMATEGSR